MMHKNEKLVANDTGIHRKTRRLLSGSFNHLDLETGGQRRKIVDPSSEGFPILYDYPTAVETAGKALFLGPDEDAIVYINQVHGISRYSEVRGSARGLRPGDPAYICMLGQLGVQGNGLVSMVTGRGTDPSAGIPHDPERPWGVVLFSGVASGYPEWTLLRTADFEGLFAQMSVKPERLLPLRGPDLVGQDFVGLKGGTGVELASGAATAEDVIRSSPLRFCRPGETPGAG